MGSAFTLKEVAVEHVQLTLRSVATERAYDSDVAGGGLDERQPGPFEGPRGPDGSGVDFGEPSHPKHGLDANKIRDDWKSVAPSERRNSRSRDALSDGQRQLALVQPLEHVLPVPSIRPNTLCGLMNHTLPGGRRR